MVLHDVLNLLNATLTFTDGILLYVGFVFALYLTVDICQTLLGRK